MKKLLFTLLMSSQFCYATTWLVGPAKVFT